MPGYDGSLDDRTGYDPDFIGPHIEPPALRDDADAVHVADSPIIKYTRFSVCLSKSRKLARWVAWNIDGSSLRKEGDSDTLSRKGLVFKADPRVDADLQTLNPVYEDNRLDRGHIARRADLLWGDRKTAQAANRDSFFLTNVTPQMDNFNESRLKGVWGCLENALLEQVDESNSKVTVMAGPVLAPTDVPYGTVWIPVEFWKLLIYQRDNELRTRGFILKQKLEGLGPPRRRGPLDRFEMYERTVDEIAEKAGVTFDPILQAAQLRGRRRTRGRVSPAPITDTRRIEW